MRGRVLGGLDVVAVLAAVLAVVMAIVYDAVIRGQGDSSPAWWVFAVLGVAAVLCLVGAPARATYRMPVLLVAAALLGLLGLLGILSIGLPILLASGLALVAAMVAPAPSAVPSGR